MEFVYHIESSKDILTINGEVYNYLFKARRERVGKIIPFRNLKDSFLYFYKVESITKKRATLTLVHKEYKVKEPKRDLHLFWCIIDSKVIQSTLPMLNEIGVEKITFVYCERSQKNFKIRLEKLRKILINSSQQCGRSSLMELEIAKDLKKIIKENSNLIILDFSKNKANFCDNIEKVLVGPEGGFSQNERELFKELKIVGFDSELILRSESAAVAIASKVLL